MTNPFPTEEPSAIHREFSSQMRQMFVALVKSGFSEAQAMHILGVTIASAMQNPGSWSGE